MTAPLSPPDLRRLYLFLTLTVFATVLALLVLNNATYLFATPLYEDGDLAANSLAVLRSKDFHEIYGAYSRWNFHHPGPGLFYGYAWSELLFHDWLHLTPTGFNSQLLAVLVISVGFFAAGLGVGARWVRHGLFVPLALLLTAMHTLAMNPAAVFLGCWTPHAMTMIFFAMLMAASSVAAGQGEDLPLLVLSGSLLIHIHVAQPLFFLPVFVLAYAALAVQTWREGRGRRELGVPSAARSPWGRFPRAHVYAGTFALLFLVPLLVDLRLGGRSNLALILDHLRNEHSERHPWLDSLYYFLRFGSYKPSEGEYIYPEGTSGKQVWDFVRSHPTAFVLWLACLLAPLLAKLAGRWRAVLSVTTRSDHDPALVARGHGWRWHFLTRLLTFWGITVALTLYWGHSMDGTMYYYNAWFDYSIWLVLGVIGVAAASDLVETAVSRFAHPWAWTAALSAACLVATGAVAVRHRKDFRNEAFANQVSLTGGRTVLETLSTHPGSPRTKFLIFPDLAWPEATAVTAILTREGISTRVSKEWETMFGSERTPDHAADGLPWRPGGGPPLELWRIVEMKDHPELAGHALVGGWALEATETEIDPSRHPEIVFNGDHPNSDDYVVDGWPSSAPGLPYAFSAGSSGSLAFRPGHVAEGDSVVMTIDGLPYNGAGKIQRQRVIVSMNGNDVGTVVLDVEHPSAIEHLRIPAAVWNHDDEALMILQFPDARSPKETGESDDWRLLGLGARKIGFRTSSAHENPDIDDAGNLPVIDPADQAEIRFVGAEANSKGFVFEGWSDPEKESPYIWSVGNRGLLEFRARPVAENQAVELTFDCLAYPAKQKLSQQRFRVQVNGTDLGISSVAVGAAPAQLPRVRIPAAVWNRYDAAELSLDFLDATSPKQAGENEDPRLLALGMRRIIFRVVPADSPAQP